MFYTQTFLCICHICQQPKYRVVTCTEEYDKCNCSIAIWPDDAGLELDELRAIKVKIKSFDDLELEFPKNDEE